MAKDKLRFGKLFQEKYGDVLKAAKDGEKRHRENRRRWINYVSVSTHASWRRHHYAR